MSLAPAPGESIATQAGVLLVGNPNKDATFYAPYHGAGARTPCPAPPQRSSDSSIDALSLTALAVSTTEVIEDYTSPYLGSLLSLAVDAKSVAALYDSATIVVYSPVRARKFPYYNTGGGALNDVDSTVGHLACSKLPLWTPMSLRGQTLAVSGFTVVSGTCYPSVRVYKQAGAANAGGAWSLSSSFRLNKPSSGAFANAHECPPDDAVPQGLLPVKLSEDELTLAVRRRARHGVVRRAHGVRGAPAEVRARAGEQRGRAGLRRGRGLLLARRRRAQRVQRRGQQHPLVPPRGVAAVRQQQHGHKPASSADHAVGVRGQRRAQPPAQQLAGGGAHATFLQFASNVDLLFALILGLGVRREPEPVVRARQDRARLLLRHAGGPGEGVPRGAAQGGGQQRGLQPVPGRHGQRGCWRGELRRVRRGGVLRPALPSRCTRRVSTPEP